MTEKTEIKFTEIVQMIADGNVPEGAKFYIGDASCYFNGDHLVWDNCVPVWLTEHTVKSQWFMEVPEQELSLAEAIEEWRKGNKVKVVFDSSVDIISSYTDLDTIWEVTALGDLDDLLFNSEYYKVQ